MLAPDKHKKIIVGLSIILPIAVAALFGIKINLKLPVFLPPIYATINGITFFVLIAALWAIKNGRKQLHQNLMKTALILSALFLVFYVIYHITSNSTSFLGQGFIRYVYFSLLISHILLSIIVIPFVLITFSKALLQDFTNHKKIARIAFPLWLYVTFSGVIVYLLISPYYIH